MPDGFDFLIERPIAHRGLHDAEAGRPENTLGAAKAAVEAGYAIECDVRLSADGKAIVFHDDRLDRLTGKVGNLSDLTAEQAGGLRVLGSDEHAPPLGDLLALVRGKVPLVIELKGDGRGADRLAQAVAEVIDQRQDRIAFMSFSHDQFHELRSRLPNRPVGLVAMGRKPADLTRHRAAIETADFVSFNVDELDNPFCAEVRERDLPLLCWTVRSAEQAQWAYRYCDQITFEGFCP